MKRATLNNPQAFGVSKSYQGFGQFNFKEAIKNEEYKVGNN